MKLKNNIFKRPINLNYFTLNHNKSHEDYEKHADLKSDFTIDLREIGSILQEERKKRSLTIEEISNILHLRRHIIEGIENGSRENLPHEVYIKGYIREYAKLLNLTDAIEPFLKKNIINNSEILSNTTKAKNKKYFLIQRNYNIFSKNNLVYLLVVAGVISIFLFLNINKENKENAKFMEAIKISNEVQTIDDHQRQHPVIQQNKKLMITCHERTWLSIIMDGKEKKEFTLNPGEVIILNARERFDILVGNAGGIKFILNGKDVGFSGASGQVKRITL